MAINSAVDAMEHKHNNCEIILFVKGDATHVANGKAEKAGIGANEKIGKNRYFSSGKRMKTIGSFAHMCYALVEGMGSFLLGKEKPPFWKGENHMETRNENSADT